MIVRSTEKGWEIVFQSAHALLAGQIGSHLLQSPKIPFWFQTLAAVVDHDDHKESFGRNVYLTELGAPKDFTQFKYSANERFTEAKRRIENGYRKHRWIGLLAGRHAEELYKSNSITKRLDELITNERRKRRSILRDLKVTEEKLEAAYSALQWCDRLSLILCQNAVPAMHRRVEIAKLLDQVRYETWERENGKLMIEPWPFASSSITVSLEVRTVTQLAFRSDTELEKALLDCDVEERNWTFEIAE